MIRADTRVYTTLTPGVPVAVPSSEGDYGSVAIGVDLTLFGANADLLRLAAARTEAAGGAS